jgi:plasmid stabilization system protein ParE
MDLQVILTLRATQDLREIADYIRADNPARAISFGEELFGRALSVGELPKAGRMVLEIGDAAVREVIHQAYRIIYEIYPDRGIIYVLRFWHAARGKPIILPRA